MRRVPAALAVVVLALVVSGCGGSDGPERGAGAAAPGLTDVSTVADFRDRFNADEGMPRLVVLVAPT